jgi:hypothetical protein
MHLRTWDYLTKPPLTFADLAREAAPEVEVQVLEPGQSLVL